MRITSSFTSCILQTKIEYDRLIASIGKKVPPEAGIKVRWRGGGISLAQRRDFIQQLQNLTGDGPIVPMELNPKEFQGFQLALLNKVKLSGALYRFCIYPSVRLASGGLSRLTECLEMVSYMSFLSSSGLQASEL